MSADLPALVVYARTSTDDLQSPEDSLAWEVSRAEALVKGRATIISVLHETDTSRSIPWARRPRAAQLLAQLYSPDRDWDGIVIGEPQRAFVSAAQVQDVLPRLADGGATLWVPEVGGPVDPGSEAHDIMLSLFGGLSRAERRRFQVRVRAAKEAQATTGRFQGGRPPVATPDERRQLYAGLGLSLAYERRTVNGQVRELFRPSFSCSFSPGGDPRSNPPCRRGDLNPHVLADTSPSS